VIVKAEQTKASVAYAIGSYGVVLLFLYTIYLLLYPVSIMQHTWLPFQNNLFLCACRDCWFLYLCLTRELFRANSSVSILVCRPCLCDPDLLRRAPSCRASWSLVTPYVSPVAHGPRGGLYPLRLTGRMRSLSVTSPTLAGRDG
jgi:hypothetical protein